MAFLFDGVGGGIAFLHHGRIALRQLIHVVDGDGNFRNRGGLLRAPSVIVPISWSIVWIWLRISVM